MFIKSEDILVRVLETPNPLAVKLVMNFPVKMEGKANFTKKEELEKLPLLKHLFEMDGVHQIHTYENMISLNHEGKLSFEDVEKQAVQIIKKYANQHDPYFKTGEEEKKKKSRKGLSKEQLEIEDILDRTIRPGLQADGGDLEVVSFKDNKIEISYQGACGGCPSSYMGTLHAIENILRYELKNDQIEVYPV